MSKENESLTNENDSLMKSKELAEGQLSMLKRSLEATQKDLKDKEKQVIFTTGQSCVDGY